MGSRTVGTAQKSGSSCSPSVSGQKRGTWETWQDSWSIPQGKSLLLLLLLSWLSGGLGAELSCFNPSFPTRQIHLLLHMVNELRLIIICTGHHLLIFSLKSAIQAWAGWAASPSW